MTTQAHGNLSGSSGEIPDAGFEASGLSPEEAERLAASFKPSWELDEAPFAQGNGLDRAQIEALSGDLHNADARTVAAHAPPQRVETHEPEVSVIIDRSITAAEMEAQRAPASARPPAPAVAPFVAPAFAAPALAPAPHAAPRVAPVLRGRSPDESLELPASLRKSNKGLFIGLGVAVAAAALVLLGVHGATSSSSETTTSGASTATTAMVPSPTTTSTATDTAGHASIPPPPVAFTPPTPAVVATVQAPVAAQAVVVTPPPRNIPVVTPKSLPRAAPAPAPVVHRAAPRNPPTKPAAGGIVRDNPF